MPTSKPRGWQVHPSTRTGHHFAEGSDVSACKRERRTTGPVQGVGRFFICVMCTKALLKRLEGLEADQLPRSSAECESVVALPEVDAGLERFANEPTFDNAISLARAILASSAREGPGAGGLGCKHKYNTDDPAAKVRRCVICNEVKVEP